jgi:hypothetical protein
MPQSQLDAYLNESILVPRRKIIASIDALREADEVLGEVQETLDNVEDLFRVFVPNAPEGTPHLELGQQALEQAFIDGMDSDEDEDEVPTVTIDITIDITVEQQPESARPFFGGVLFGASLLIISLAALSFGTH